MSDNPIIRRSGLTLESPNGIDAKVIEAKFNPGLVKKPHIDVLLTDAYIVINRELAGLRRKVTDGEPLSESESRKLSNLTASLVKLAAEEREQQKQDRIEDLDDKELLAQATVVLEKMRK